MNKRINIVSLLIVFAIAFTGVIQVSAQKDLGSPFSVQPILPTNQDANIDSYISITPGGDTVNQTLEFIITNNQDKQQTVHIESVNAYTSPNGIVEYVKTKNRNSEIVDGAYEMIEHLALIGENRITLEPNEKRKVKTELNIDNIDNIDGMLLGGVSFQTTVDNGEADEESFQIENNINQLIGVVINTPTDKDVQLSFGDVLVDPMPSYYVVRLPITQNSPNLLNNMEMEYAVAFQGEELFGSTKEIDFAPMSKANFAIPFEAEEIKKNKPYVLKGALTYIDQDQHEQVIEFEKTFRFDGNTNSDDDGNTFTPPILDGISYWWFLLLLLIPVIAYWIYRNRTYVLLNDDDPVLRIQQDSPLFQEVKSIKDVKKDEIKSKFIHYYVKKKQKDKAIHFAYHKTKNNQ